MDPERRITAPQLFAGTILLRLLRKTLFTHKGLFQYFRVWQDAYLNYVIHFHVERKCQRILRKLKGCVLSCMNFRLQLKLKRSLGLWRKNAKIEAMKSVSVGRLQGALGVCDVLLGSDLRQVDSRFLPLFYARPGQPLNSQAEFALSRWKCAVTSALLKENHQELAVTQLVGLLKNRVQVQCLASFTRIQPKGYAETAV